MNAVTPHTARGPLLDIEHLSVRFTTPDGLVTAADDISLEVRYGECAGIVGESGSGKSQTFLAVMGLLARNGRATGTLRFAGDDLLTMHSRSLNRLRGSRLAMVFQDPLTALTPHLCIGTQMREVLSTHENLRGARADARCLEWLDRMHIPDARRRLRQYPHQLSGGMRQRVMLAMAMLCTPELLIADEPTTALDVSIQADILDLMDAFKRDHGTSIVLITHDMGVIARLADRVHVFGEGQVLESAPVEKIFAAPEHLCTRRLLNAVPRFDRRPIDTPPDAITIDTPPLLEVKQLRVCFPQTEALFRRSASLRAIDGVSFTLQRGETLAIVGESGSGKSTLARAVLQLVASDAGTVCWMGTALESLDRQALRRTRRDLQIVFQDPLASLDPSATIGQSIHEPLRVHEPALTTSERHARVCRTMERTGLDPRLIDRYPHELSGGQNQRVGIARATILEPRLVICDEAVSALDVSIQAQILALLDELQRDIGLSYVFISHDMSVVYRIAHRVLVLYRGTVVELASRDALFGNPQHPYTRELLSAVPVPDPKRARSRQRLRLAPGPALGLRQHAALRFLPSRAAQDAAPPRVEERFPGHFVAEHDPLDTLLQ